MLPRTSHLIIILPLPNPSVCGGGGGGGVERENLNNIDKRLFLKKLSWYFNGLENHPVPHKIISLKLIKKLFQIILCQLVFIQYPIQGPTHP